MRTIILPGYSLHNKEWAYEVKENIGSSTEVVEWKHWVGGNMSVPKEIDRILKIIGNDSVNIIAKSVGTRVSMELISRVGSKIEKLILCGIPTRGESEVSKKNYSPLSSFPPEKVLIIQNTKDPFASYEEINKFNCRKRKIGP